MGLFGDIFPGKRRTGKRGKGKTPKEKALLLDVAYIQELKRSTVLEDRELYHEIMAGRLGRKKRPEKSELAQFVETADMLREAHILQDPSDVGKGFNWKDVLQGLGELGKNAPAIIESVRGVGQQEPVYEQPPGDAPQIEAPRKLIPMTWLSRFLIARVQNPITKKMKAPSEVADMLLEHYDDTSLPMVRELVDGFCQTPDEQMGEFLQSIAAKYPDLHGFLAWMQSEERRQWYAQCILAVRANAEGGVKMTANGGI